MADEVVIFALVEPAPGKLDRLKEVLTEAAKWAKANEPGTLEFSVYEDTGSDSKICLFEKYENQAAMEKHESSENYKKVMGTLAGEELVAGAPIITHAKQFTGYKR